MEAPEKIYVEISDGLIPQIGHASVVPQSEDSVEYTRTDAFIRKAHKYFIKELPNFRSFMESGTAFIKNFESFIQGE